MPGGHPEPKTLLCVEQQVGPTPIRYELRPTARLSVIIIVVARPPVRQGRIVEHLEQVVAPAAIEINTRRACIRDEIIGFGGMADTFMNHLRGRPGFQNDRTAQWPAQGCSQPRGGYLGADVSGKVRG